ncbi:MAG: hypothetical protein ACREO8_04475, partial [Luteimonas sp.]
MTQSHTPNDGVAVVVDASTPPTHSDQPPAAIARDIGSNHSFLLTPPPTANAMRVTKRSGSTEAVDLNKIVRAVQRAGDGLHAVDPMRVATRTISGLYD